MKTYILVLMLCTLTSCGLSELTVSQPQSYPDPPINSLDATKGAVDTAIAAERETAWTQPRPSVGIHTPEPARPTWPPFPPGITADCEAGARPFLDRHKNCYFPEDDSLINVVVYAGASDQANRQGALFFADPRADIFPTPRQAGAIKIIAVEGMFITVQSEDGSIFIFDAASRQWVDAVQQQAAYPAPSPRPTLYGLDAEKAADMTQIVHQIETAAAAPTRSTPYVFETAPPITIPPRPTGYSLDCEGIDSPFVIRKTNCWYGSTGGIEVEIHVGLCGECSDTPDLGAITVYDIDTAIGPEAARVIGYKTPRATGRLTIIDVTGTYFTFHGENGTIVIFDAASRQWVDAIPTATPDLNAPSSTIITNTATFTATTSTNTASAVATPTAVVDVLPVGTPTPHPEQSAIWRFMLPWVRQAAR